MNVTSRTLTPLFSHQPHAALTRPLSPVCFMHFVISVIYVALQSKT